MTRPTLAELVHTQPGHLIRRAHQLAWAAFTEETREFDVTPIQYSALVAVAEHPGIEAVRIAELVSIDRATIGSVLSRLEKRGLVTREPHATDGRAKHIFLTAAGKRLLGKLEGISDPIAERILGPLSTRDRDRLVALLRQLLREPHAADRPAGSRK